MKALRVALAMMALVMSTCVCGAAVAAVEAVPTDSLSSNAIIAWATVASLAFSLGNTAYTWITSRDKVTDKKFAELEKEFHALELEHTQLKGRVDALPTQSEMQSLGRQVQEVDGDMKQANAKLEGLDKRLELLGGTAQRIEQFLLDNAGSKRGR